MRLKPAVLFPASLLLLAACSGDLESPRPDYRIGVVRDSETGKTLAISKPCPVWHESVGDGLQNDFRPQFGCYDSYNLARMVDRPSDLVEGRRASDAEAEPGVLGIERYRTGKTKQLINPKDMPSATTQD